MAREPAPEVIVPFVIAQEYVAPAPASGTLALPEAPLQSDEGAVIVADGSADTATFAEPLAVHEAAVRTVTESATDPVTPAVNVTQRVPRPAVIVPPEMVHV